MEKDIFLTADSLISQALKKFNSEGEKVLLVTEVKKLIGVVTDGDIRRAVLAGSSLNDPITRIYNRSPSYIFESDFEPESVKKLLLDNRIDLVPVVNKAMDVVDFITWDLAFSEDGFPVRKKGQISLPVVIMAGGKGTRLEPVTTIIPKPLIPVGSKTIVEHIMDRFMENGINTFYFTLNYLGEMIKAYIGSVDLKNTLHYIFEDDFYGTAGSLKLGKDQLPDTFIVSNCDIIVETDYSKILAFHQKSNAFLTMVSAFQRHSIPYGVIDFKEEGVVTKIHEKPEKTVVINTGVYVVNLECLDYIPDNKMFHMTHLIEALMEDGKKVCTYPINETEYIDIGQWDEYRKAVKQFS